MLVCARYSRGMNLLLDCGNSRLKWAIASDDPVPVRCFLERGVVSYDAMALSAWATHLERFPIAQIRFSSVIAPQQEENVFAALASLTANPVRFRVSLRAGALRNAYATPDTLGVDRWAAAIGAWETVRKSCLVVSAGTATTIDLIESSQPDAAVYRGGLILPGLALMLQSLHQRTARLPQAEGRYCAAPCVADNTHDAMTSGALEATCGAIERMGRRLGGDAPWLLTGGNAKQLQAVLGQKVRVVEDLVLQGLATHELMGS
ncbi:MAG: type III pantothenate kinase [Fluviibacter sp.]